MKSNEAQLLKKLVYEFNDGLGRYYRARLVARDDEPLYEPETPEHAAQIGYMRHNLNSALHELAHWCIAGWRRRQLVDYGYWYVPDGRTAAQQAEFERVELRPQALEWCFQEALGRAFEPSVDNLSNPVSPDERLRFKARIQKEKERMLNERGLPYRAKLLLAMLKSIV